MANLKKCIEYFLQYISLDVFHHLAQTPSATRSGVIFWTTVCTLDGFFSCISSDLPCARNAFSHASQVANIWMEKFTDNILLMLVLVLRHFLWIFPDLPCATKAFSPASQLAKIWKEKFKDNIVLLFISVFVFEAFSVDVPDLPRARKAFSHASQLARYEWSFWQEPRYTYDKTGI